MTTAETGCRATVRGEFKGAQFGDARLSARLVALAEGVGAMPEESLPHAMQTEKALDAAYRFFNNDAVKPSAILEPHRVQTVGRMKEEKLVLVAHDTTSLVFGGHREGLGRVPGRGTGFLLHVSLAMTADGLRRPLGVVDSTTWVRKDAPRSKLENGSNRSGSDYAKLENRESERWGKQVTRIAERVDDRVQMIHLMDREADCYELLEQLVRESHRFVIRSCKDRNVRERGSDAWEHLHVVEQRATIKAEREVALSRRASSTIPNIARTFPMREARTTTLAISAMTVELRRPRYLHDATPTLTLHLVRVVEPDPPADLEPIDWCLLTTEPIETASDTLAIVDHYRGRWLIEEYFKALKTGCDVEKLQLETYTGLSNAVSVYLPIAADILRLRNLAEREPNASAEHMLSRTQIAVLGSVSALPLAASPTVAQVHLAIAMLGGYQRHARRPGWLVLARGWQDLLMYERGWIAREKLGRDVGEP
jgi:hypothetical protein